MYRNLLLAILLAGLVGGSSAVVAAPLSVSPAEWLDRLAEVESEAARVAPGTPLTARTPQFAFVLSGVYQGITNLYADDRSRYFAVQLVAVNTTDLPQTLDVQSIRLRTAGKLLRWQDRPGAIDVHSFQSGREHIAIREVQPPDTLTVAPQLAAATWLVFAGLEEGSFVPDLMLEIPAESGALELDVTLYQRAVLRLQTELLGPAGCLALVRVAGALNTVNAGALAAELERLSDRRTHRVVLTFDSDAPPNQFLIDWLKQARQPNLYLHQFKQMPVFPVTTQELHLVLSKSDAADSVGTVHTRVEDAVAAALRTAFAAAPAEDIVHSLRSEHASVRIAALRFGASRLQPAQLPLVLRQLAAADAEVRRAAVAALGDFAAPAAIDALAQLARSTDSALAGAAVRSLAESRFPAAHAALADLISAGLPLPPQELVAILAEYPRPEWREAVLRLTTSTESKVQQSAMQALARLGHSQLMAVLVEGLASEEARVREEAFQRLCDIGTREADEVALAYALDWLQTQPPSGAIQSFLVRIREQSAVPLLVRHLDAPEGVRRNILELLAEVGDQSVAAEIVQRYPQFTVTEQGIALDTLRKLDSPLARPLALAALQSEESNLVQQAISYLQTERGDDVVAALEGVLASAQSKSTFHGQVLLICNALGNIGTPQARRALLKARRSSDETVRQAGEQGLQMLWSQSPARDIVLHGEQYLDRARWSDEDAAPAVDNPDAPQNRESARARDLALAEQAFDAARRIDDQFPELYQGLGLLHVERQQLEAAVASFRRAIELNDKLVLSHAELGQTLYNLQRFAESLEPLRYAFENDSGGRQSQWLTTRALALLQLGRLEEGVALLQEQAPKFAAAFQGQSVFEYNQACVYSRAVELLRKDSRVAADDPRLQVFTEEALRHLHTAFQLDFAGETKEPDMLAFTRADPDLVPLHGNPAFRELTELDLPEEQRTKPAPRPPTPRPDGELLNPL